MVDGLVDVGFDVEEVFGGVFIGVEWFVVVVDVVG